MVSHVTVEYNRSWRERNRARYNKTWREWARKNTDRRKPTALKYRQSIHGKYMTLSQRAGVTFTESEYAEIVSHPCFYCGGILPLAGCGLDRILNDKGYAIDNVVPCCTTCNRIKGATHTLEETVVMVRARDDFRRKRGN